MEDSVIVVTRLVIRLAGALLFAVSSSSGAITAPTPATRALAEQHPGPRAAVAVDGDYILLGSEGTATRATYTEGTPKRSEAHVERLIQDLVSEDAKVAREAGDQLKRMPEAVPVLFAKLVEADWELKPPLLEVLARIKDGRDYARLKLLHGTDEEKTYAALLYELIDQGEDTESREYAAMVDVLLKAIKSEDKKLRAAAGLALIYEENSAKVLFEHFYEIIPALISSFDTDLVIFRGWRDNPFDATFTYTCASLDALIGDRQAYLDIRSTLWKNTKARGVPPASRHSRYMAEFLPANRAEIEQLRTYWQSWWNKHSELTLAEIGTLIIERNLRLLPEEESTDGTPSKSGTETTEQYLKRIEQYHRAKGSLLMWTGKRDSSVEELRSWWVQHKATYEGPIAKASVVRTIQDRTDVDSEGTATRGTYTEAPPKRSEAHVERLIQDLVSEDTKVVREARDQLKRMPEAVPVLFAKLVEADWELKPPLLEVLASIKDGRDHARLKLLHGTDEEKTYAALLYELIDQGEDTESREYAAMVEVLLKALNSQEKNLRAVAALGLLHDEPHSLFFEHFHRLIPAMISSFDTPVVIDRGPHDPSSTVFLGICIFLDTLIGGRLAYLEVQPILSNNAEERGADSDSSPQQEMAEFLAGNRAEIEKLRRYWQNWWGKHAKLSPVDIGTLLIKRNIPLLQRDRWDEQRLAAEYSLKLWTIGVYEESPEDWASWWAKHEDNYQGPIIKGE